MGRKAVTKITRPDGRAKCTVYLTAEASQKLTVHAAMMNFDRSELIEKLINDNLKRYVVSDRERSKQAGGGAGEGAAE